MKRVVREARQLHLAAELVACGASNRSCLAIDQVVGATIRSPLRLKYARTMLAGTENPYELEWPGGPDSVEANDIRILLLCFAAELALTGDLRRNLSKVLFGKVCRRHPLYRGMRFYKGDPSKAGGCVGCTEEYSDKRRTDQECRRIARKRTRDWRDANPDFLDRQRRLYKNQKAANRGKYGLRPYERAPRAA